MRAMIAKSIGCITGLILFALLLIPAMSNPVRAEPLLAITATPQEPAQPTTPPQPTSPPPTAPPQPTSPPAAPNPTEPPAPQPTVAPNAHAASDKGTPDVAIVKTADQSSVARGDLMGFTLHVTNDGTATAKDVVASDTLPAYLDLLDYAVSKGTVSVSGRTITAAIGTLSTGEYVTVRVRAYLSSDAPAMGSNTGAVTSSNHDSDSDNNSSAVSFTILQALPSATPVVPTDVPVVAAPEQPAPSAQVPTAKPPVSVAQPTKRPPVRLPDTGDGDDQSMLLITLVLVSLIMLSIGWAMRRRA